MSDLSHDEPINNAKLLLPVVIMGLFALIAVMYFGGINSGFYAN